jgi:hypothetical protein
MSAGDVIAVLALVVSGYAAWTTSKFNQRQKSLIESQERLNALLLVKEESEAAEEKKADLGATVIKLGSSNYRVKIWNKGKAAARNIAIDFPDGNDLIINSEVERKFPLEVLDRLQAVELIASVHMGTKSKHTVRLNWSDDSNETNEKTIYLTV